MVGFALMAVAVLAVQSVGAFAAPPVVAPPSRSMLTDVLACNASDPIPGLLKRAGVGGYDEEPTAGTWHTWYVSPDQTPITAPPDTASAQTAQELAELAVVQATRTDAQVQKARQYDNGAASQFWEDLMLQRIITHSSKDGSKNPPRLSRAFAIFETAMYDAGVAVYAAKYCYDRPAPSVLLPALQPAVPVRNEPSYPSEHAAMAAAAYEVYKWLFPCPDPADTLHCEEPVAGLDAQLAEAAESRIWAGTNYRSDVDAGLAIGHFVAQRVLAIRAADHASDAWTGTVPVGRCLWVPTPPGFRASPVEPNWGHVTPFMMTSGSQFRAPPPLDCDSAAFMAQTKDLYDTSFSLTDRQKEIANYWAGGQGTETPPGQNLHIALNETIRHHLDTMQHVRVMAYDAAALADAAIGCWETKFTYWVERPVTTIRREYGDSTWTSYIVTPPFPGYISGHSSFSGASSTVLQYFFPEDAVSIRAMATEAADSRFYGGIHIRQDNEAGLILGGHVGDLAIALAQQDGGPLPQ